MPQTDMPIGTIAEINAGPGDIVRLVYVGDAYIPADNPQRSQDENLGLVGEAEVVFAELEPISISSDGAFYVMVEKSISNMTEEEKGAALAEARERISELERDLQSAAGGSENADFYQHIKRGTVYRVLGAGRLQSSEPLADDAELLAYRDIEDGSLWFRSPKEFHDGRFVKV